MCALTHAYDFDTIAAFCLAPAQKEDVDVAPARPAARVSKPAPVKQAAPAAAPVNKKPAPAAAPAKPVQHSVPAQPAVTAKPAAAPAHASNAPAKQVAATKVRSNVEAATCTRGLSHRFVDR